MADSAAKRTERRAFIFLVVFLGPILAVAIVLVNLLSTTVYFSTAFLGFVLAMATEGIDSVAVSVLSVLILAFGLLVSCCIQFFLPVVAFVRLRELKEGGETEGLSSVFH